jgi:hypothetical protein
MTDAHRYITDADQMPGQGTLFEVTPAMTAGARDPWLEELADRLRGQRAWYRATAAREAAEQLTIDDALGLAVPGGAAA